MESGRYLQNKTPQTHQIQKVAIKQINFHLKIGLKEQFKILRNTLLVQIKLK